MRIRKQQNCDDVFHIGFNVALILKAINGLFETLGGILLIFLSPNALSRIIRVLTQEELSEDPRDLIANALMQLSLSFSLSAQHFGIIYLISHGVVKLFLVILLWKKKLWAYPMTIIFLILFIGYQVYKYSISHSIMMVLLTILDMVVVLFTSVEYKRQKLISAKDNK